MKKTAFCFVLFALSGSWFVWPGASQACEVEYEIPGLIRLPYTGSRTIQIPRFDPSLGTLESVTLHVVAQFSGVVGGYGTGPANAPNGWAIEFSGTIRLNAPSFPVLSRSFTRTRSGLVWQPGTPVYEVFGPENLGIGPMTIHEELEPYIGTGTVSATVSWPAFYTDLFWSRSGVTTEVSRELGVVGGMVTYTFQPNPGDCTCDGDIDLEDLTIFDSCLTGPGTEVGVECGYADFDGDGDSDLSDFAYFQTVFLGI